VKSGLPVEVALPALRAALGGHGSAVLEAPPGAGKSTVVPLALLAEGWAAGKRLLMLEPRRIAARAVAQRMAASLGEEVGRTVGYRMRLDTRVSPGTRIEVVTQGVLTRMLQDDPALDGVAAVLFDEFHERSLEADLGLALCLDARAQLSSALRILVMSATLDGAAVARLLEDAPRVSVAGESFPVDTHYAGRGAPLLAERGAASPAEGAEQLIARLVRRALREAPGDLLVFLPGAREIRRVQALLESGEAAGRPAPGARVLPLFGDLSPAEQDAALAPAASGTRNIVLATNIAETSLTLPGVRVVVDSGLARRARFDPATGMGRLETVRISRASAEQRRGRAGRLAPGVCYRAWSEGAHESLAPFTPPEIVEADLAPLALELAEWGVREAQSLAWLDPPPAAMLAQARELLVRLGALGGDGRITTHGRDMARLPLHPRLAHMLLKARDLGAVPLAARLAALLSERDLLRGGAGARDADVRTRLELFEDRHGTHAAGRAAVDRGGLERVRRITTNLERQLPGRPLKGASGRGSTAPGALLAFAYPDRIGRRRAGADGRFTLANGRGAAFAAAQSLARSEFIVAVDVDDTERDARILLAAPLERAALKAQFAERIRQVDAVAWSSREQAVIARRTLALDALVLDEQPLADPEPQAVLEALLAGVRELGIAALPWDRESRELKARVAFVRAAAAAGAPGASAWPELTEAALSATLDTWLAPWLAGVTRREQLARVPLERALAAQLSFEQQRALEREAPTHLTVPSGSRIRIDYGGEDAPAVEVRLQEVFGLEATPRLGPNRVPVTFRLLSPAQRPVQVTRDLASFWRGAYAEVRRQLRGRYPRHYWPEDPLTAEPTRGVRRRR
jgi:ATP-dependent helicase HrpB